MIDKLKKSGPSRLDKIFIHETKHISPYGPHMENVIINMPRTKEAVKTLMLELIGEVPSDWTQYDKISYGRYQKAIELRQKVREL